MAGKPDGEDILNWLQEDEEINSEFVFSGDDSNSDAPSEHVEHCSDTEQSGLSDQDEPMIIDDNVTGREETNSTLVAVQGSNNPKYIGRDGITSWYVHKPNKNVTKTQRQNIISKLPGVKGTAKNCKSVLECWQIFFPDDMIQNITTYTNNSLREMRAKYSRDRDCPLTNTEEIYAFFGILYMLGVKKANHLRTSEMWTQDGTAPDYFRAIMSERRFHTLLRAIRFDNKDTRNNLDNVSPIRDIFEQFVKNCMESYTPGEYCTLDEMLEGFRGRAKFRQYISNKPDKYGLKI